MRQTAGPRGSTDDYGHWPLFTHPGAGVAFKVGDAKGCAGVVAGGPSVTVAPMLIAVGSTDIVGTSGDTYVPPVAESPDPPARFCGWGASGCARTRTAAVMSALPPSPAESRVSCLVRMVCLQRPAGNRSHRNWLLPIREMSTSGTTASSNSLSVSTPGMSTIIQSDNRLSGPGRRLSATSSESRHPASTLYGKRGSAIRIIELPRVFYEGRS